jgi:cation transporter-like permease
MESNLNNKSMLLPNSMKFVGIILSVLSLGAGITFKSVYDNLDSNDLMALLTYTGMILGLLFLSLSREKIEDERVDKLRAQSMQFAFIFAVISTVTRPLIDFTFGDPIQIEEAHSVIFVMLLVYNLFFLFLKRRA